MFLNPKISIKNPKGFSSNQQKQMKMVVLFVMANLVFAHTRSPALFPSQFGSSKVVLGVWPPYSLHDYMLLVRDVVHQNARWRKMCQMAILLRGS